MKKTCKILIIMALIICISLQIAISFAADKQFAGQMILGDTKTYEQYKYVELENNKAAIDEYTGLDVNVTIPKTINGREVTIICNHAFYQNSTVQTITLPDTTKQIESGAFSKCSNLMTVNIPSTIDFIGLDFFDNCPKLKNYTIPSGLTRGQYGDVKLYDLTITGTKDYDMAKEIFDLTNKERENYGLKPLKYTFDLSEKAMLRATELSVWGNKHYRPNGDWSIRYRKYGY